ncbi:ALPL [Branchiostoma lanceolatum]|uniref:Alkaline phosphatase, tissue-nonspecific isozyme n=2 Tax=Branchiostoma lanceolatum TaxID=7740 RepID=A0A8K0A1J2_BRALA|nr:ALPL [Branchiostoma lanceolatum]
MTVTMAGARAARVCVLLTVLVTVTSGSLDDQAHRGRARSDARDYGGAPEAEENPAFWNNMAGRSIQDALRIQRNHNTNVAKNVVLFLGDGMGAVSVTSARILKGQKAGNPGEETMLAMDTLPHMAHSKTYNIDAQTPDSGATGTAFLCGVKARFATIGVDGRALLEDCNSTKGREVQSVLAWAEMAGKSTGIVTTTRVTHATPAAAYAHTAYREWEVDSVLSDAAVQDGCKDISAQLVDDNPGIEVVLGGGRVMFHNGTDPEYPDDPGSNGVRADGRHLMEEWLDGKTSARYVWNGTDFRTVNPQTTDYLLGLFEPSHMKYMTDREDSPIEEPTLVEMTRTAIQILQKNENGFFLLVEGGRIDHGHHDGKAVKAINEAVEFDDAIQVAKDLLNLDESLIVVTADHAHTVSLGGWDTSRGNPLFGKLDPDFFLEGVGVAVPDGKPYTAIQYGTGPGHNITASRQDITNVDTGNPDYLQQTAVPMASESHGAEDVAIFAGGPMAHLFHGVHEQNYIAHVMKYAACLGEYAEDCDREERVASGSARRRFSTAVVLLSILLQLAWF